METCALDSLNSVQTLIGLAHASSEPVIVLDGEEECLVAMTAAVLERILFDSALLNLEDRDSFHIG